MIFGHFIEPAVAQGECHSYHLYDMKLSVDNIPAFVHQMNPLQKLFLVESMIHELTLSLNEIALA